MSTATRIRKRAVPQSKGKAVNVILLHMLASEIATVHATGPEIIRTAHP